MSPDRCSILVSYHNRRYNTTHEEVFRYNGVMDVKDGDRVMTLAEAGALIGRSPATLYLQFRKGRLQAEMHGRQLLVRESEVRRYEREVMGKTGFASSTHPFHGTKVPGSGWPKVERDGEEAARTEKKLPNDA